MSMYNSIDYSKIIQRHLVLCGIIQEIFQLILWQILSLKYNTNITGKTTNNGNIKEVKFSVPWKHFINFWKTLDMSLINCEVSWNLTWSKNCVITDERTQNLDPNTNPPVLEIRTPTGATLKITDTKLYVPVVTLSTEENNKLLEQLKAGFKTTIKWNK